MEEPRNHPPEQNCIVTVAGHIGSGKTEVCRKLSAVTGWEVISAGAILRRMAVEQGMSVLEFNEYVKQHANIDRDIDNYIASLAKRNESVIVDSRLAWHFLPKSLKVFLVVEPVIGAQRVFRATRPDENHLSVETAAADNAERQRIERERFMQLYGLDSDNWRNYDVVLDTSDALPEQAARVLLERIHTAPPPGSGPQCWLSPKRLIPTRVTPDPAPDVEIVVAGGVCVILNGHDRVKAAVQAGAPLVQCSPIAFENELLPGDLKPLDFATRHVSRSIVQDWEAALEFRFATLPHWVPQEATVL
jgi:cytidylate kinase